MSLYFCVIHVFDVRNLGYNNFGELVKIELR